MNRDFVQKSGQQWQAITAYSLQMGEIHPKIIPSFCPEFGTKFVRERATNSARYNDEPRVPEHKPEHFEFEKQMPATWKPENGEQDA